MMLLSSVLLVTMAVCIIYLWMVVILIHESSAIPIDLRRNLNCTFLKSLDSFYSLFLIYLSNFFIHSNLLVNSAFQQKNIFSNREKDSLKMNEPCFSASSLGGSKPLKNFSGIACKHHSPSFRLDKDSFYSVDVQ